MHARMRPLVLFPLLILLAAGFAGCSREKQQPARPAQDIDVVLRPWQVARVLEQQGLEVEAVRANLAAPIDVRVTFDGERFDARPPVEIDPRDEEYLVQPRSVIVCNVRMTSSSHAFENQLAVDEIGRAAVEHLAAMQADFVERCDPEDGIEDGIDVAAAVDVINENQPRNRLTTLEARAEGAAGGTIIAVVVAESLQAAVNLPPPVDEDAPLGTLGNPRVVCNMQVGYGPIDALDPETEPFPEIAADAALDERVEAIVDALAADCLT